MKTLIFIETILLLVMTSCGKDNTSTDGFITVDVTKSSYSPKKELVLQDFMDVEYIPLETNDEFVNHGNVQAVGEKYIIVTNYRNDGDIFVYNRKGKAIRKINRKGQGAEEYTYCSGVTLDEDNNEMFIDDHFIKKVFVYDLEGNFKRSFKQKNDGGSRSYDDIFGNITKEIKVPFKEKKLFFQILRQKEGTRAAGPGLYSRIIPYNNNWILIEPSSDTIYTLMPDCSLRPFIAKTPPVHTMNPEFYLILRLISDRYYFMESVKNVYDFRKREGFPRTYFMYDTQEKDFFSYIIYNGDYSYKKELYMIMFIPINAKGEFFELCRDYEKGKLKGKLKDIAAKLGEDDNRVIMLVKPKK